jgi:Protein of unknown function (DUF3093)
MPEYREKLWPSLWVFLAVALVIPASILVFAPISMPAGVITGLVLFGGCVAILILASPVIRVSDRTLTAGPAQISADLLGEAVPHDAAEATYQRGPGLDARAWLLIRGWVKPVVRVPLEDPSDRAPYWLLSTRHPQELAAAINRSRRPAPHN